MAHPIPDDGFDLTPTIEPEQGSSTRLIQVETRVSTSPPRRLQLIAPEPPPDYDRPLTRGDCQEGGDHHHRPCPYVSCSHNLFVEHLRKKPDLDPWDVDPLNTCVLDIVDERGAVHDIELGNIMSATAFELAEVQKGAYEVVRPLLEHARERRPVTEGGGSTALGDLCSGFQGGVDAGLEEDEEDRKGRVLPDRLIIARAPNRRLFEWREDMGVPDEDEYLRAFWKVYERGSRERGEHLDRVWQSFKQLLFGLAQVLGDPSLAWPPPPPKKKNPNATKGLAWRGKRMASPRRNS